MGLCVSLGLLAGFWWGWTNKTHTTCSHRGHASAVLNRCVSTSINSQLSHWGIALIGGAAMGLLLAVVLLVAGRFVLAAAAK